MKLIKRSTWIILKNKTLDWGFTSILNKEIEYYDHLQKVKNSEVSVEAP